MYESNREESFYTSLSQNEEMRHAVLKDLIFSECTECYVELVFSEFTIKRILRMTAKSCISAYFINNSEKQAQELICFLKDKGIDS